MTKLFVTTLLATGLSLPLLAATTAAAVAQPQMRPSLLIVHGIEGADLGAGYLPTLPLDVQIDGICVTKQPVQFTGVGGPYPLVSGPHAVKISPANTLKPCGNPAVISQTVTLISSQQAALVLAESTAGVATGEFFDVTQTAPVAVGAAHATVFHTANAPAVDVTVTENSTGAVSTLSALQPGATAQATFAPFTPYSVRVLASGTTATYAGPVGFAISNRGNELLFVVGNAANGSVAVIGKDLYGAF